MKNVKYAIGVVGGLAAMVFLGLFAHGVICGLQKDSALEVAGDATDPDAESYAE